MYIPKLSKTVYFDEDYYRISSIFLNKKVFSTVTNCEFVLISGFTWVVLMFWWVSWGVF